MGSVVVRTRRAALSGLVAIAWLMGASSASAADACSRPTTLGVSFMIDDSGSMADEDPDVLRGEAVRAGLEQLPTGSIATAASFDTDARELFGPTTVDDSTRGPLADVVDEALNASGNTNYEEAFALAVEQLDAMTSADAKALIFVSDGQPSRSFSSDQDIIDRGVPIFTIGFGDADEGVLEDLAARSGGQAFWASNTGELQSTFARVVATLTCDAQTVSDTFELEPGQSAQVPFAVAADDGEFRALAAWAYGDVTVTVTRPNGSTLSESSLIVGEAVALRDTYALFSGRDPAPGAWVLNLAAAPGNDTDVSVSIDVWKRQVVRATPPPPLPPAPATPPSPPADAPTPPAPVVVATPKSGTFDAITEKGKAVTVKGNDLFQMFVEGYQNSHPCQDSEGGNWRIFGNAVLCVFSGKVFWDNDENGKARALCIVNLGTDLIPLARLKALGKAGKTLKKIESLQADAVRTLRKLKLSKSDRKLLDKAEAIPDASKLVLEGRWLDAANAVLASRKMSARLEKLLRTNGNLKAAKRLHAVQDLSSDLVKAMSGIDDVQACRKAFG